MSEGGSDKEDNMSISSDISIKKHKKAGEENTGNEREEHREIKKGDLVTDDQDEPPKKMKDMEFDKEKAANHSDESQIGDIENDDSEYGSSKKKKKDKKHKKKKSKKEDGSKDKKKKKKRKDEEASEDGFDRTESDQERADKKMKKKKDKDEDEREAVENEIKLLIEEMKDAYKTDLESIEKKEPALNKLKLLPKVEMLLRKKKHQEAFIDYEENEGEDNSKTGLAYLSDWLKKLKGGISPALQIRKKLVELINLMPLNDSRDIKNSGLGKILNEMKTNPNEDKDIRKTCKDIVDRWARIIVEAPADYKSFDERKMTRVQVSVEDVNLRKLSDLKKSVPRNVIRKTGFDFIRKPESTKEYERKSEKSGDIAEFEKQCFDLKRKKIKDF